MVTPVPPAPPDAIDIFLQPGDFYFADGSTRIRTLLGSCVSIVLWHPRQRIGGMCHFMLPARPTGRSTGALDGRYAEDALAMFMDELRRTGTTPAQYQVKLFGGGRMFEHRHERRATTDISQRNVDGGRDLLARHGFALNAQDLGGIGHRNVVFDVWSGDVWIRRVAPSKQASR